VNKIFAQLIKKRGLDDDFLHPDYEKTADPFLLPDMEKAIARIKIALKNSEKILIYGDYDVDGVTASTVMEQTLRLIGVKPENINIMLPDRFADGYGMSPKMVQFAQGQGSRLVITVDCGSRNHAIVDELNTLGIDSIITDHHETDDTLPEAVAVVNPKRKDFSATVDSGLEHLAGVGVAFKFAQALVKEGLLPDGQEKWLLDLVLLGTICDSMLLSGENRILTYYGMKVLEKTRRPGLKELMKKARVKKLSSEDIGFRLGPRLNAAGRIETADVSLELLRTNSPVKAAELASRLEELNSKRRAEQLSAISEITERGVSDEPVIIEVGDWHEGILGIVAGRLTDDYMHPSFVLTEVSDQILKGSGRSFGDFNLAEALNHVKNTIIGGGGHAGAAGVRLKRENLYQFREQINDYYRNLNLKDQTSYLKQKPDLEIENFADFSLELLEQIKTLEPYGPGNEEVVLHLKHVKIANITLMGTEKQHLRLDIKDNAGRPLKIVAFFAPEKWLKLSPETEISPTIKLVENEFRDVRSVEARLVDLGIE
jgi:single-stranded-DNA-specific exonuclease